MLGRCADGKRDAVEKLHVDFFDEFSQCTLLSLVVSRWRHEVQYKNDQFLKFAQKIFIFAQNLEKFAQKQNVPKFWKNLPNFQKLPNTCSPTFNTWLLLRKDTTKIILFSVVVS